MDRADTTLNGQVIVITGSTSGIGRAAAMELARKGARLVLVARDPKRADDVLAELRDIDPRQNHTALLGDLSLMRETARIGAEIAATEPRVDVLINNAGAMYPDRQVTPEGLERTFALNHMSYFVLTRTLLDRIPSGGRIVNTASEAHRGGRLDLSNLQSAQRYSAFRTYSMTKLANILFTRELARRTGDAGVRANCHHPGVVASRLFNNSKGVLRVLFAIGRLVMISSEKGAETLVYLASSAEVASDSGGYYSQCRPRRSTDQARDETTARGLWDESERIVASILGR
jgi:NAD(P)-dependent dehydrogenase (short-subunit alcohol dehydrogenase family)